MIAGNKYDNINLKSTMDYGAAANLQPLLNLKVDELFMKWISLPEQNDLFAKLQIVKKNRKETETRKTSNLHDKCKAAPVPLSFSANNKDESKPIVSPRRHAKNPKARQSLELTPNHTTIDNSSSNIIANTQKKSSKLSIPQFYFPNGKPNENDNMFEKKVKSVFADLNFKRIQLSQMAPICKACGCQLYWKSCLFNKSLKPGSLSVTETDIISTWKVITSRYHDSASRFIALLAKKNNEFLEFEDMLPLLRDVVDTHPGLTFLKEAPEFHTRYMNTVIARVFYTVNRSWSGKITANELRRSNFLSVLESLDTEQEINNVTDFFSYEHFYVIYCKFWELDNDHDLVIDENDLTRHSDGVLSGRLIERILSGAVTRWNDPATKVHCMSYIDFVWFLISEEDKTTRTSIEYWFRCMDLDGDGYISLYEMEYFYEEQIRKLELLDIEPLPFDDCACQMLDMIKPAKSECISLSDLKKSKMAGIFFDTFMNVEKYLEHEQKDPFANPLLDETDENTEIPKQSEWEKYAAEEYEVLVAEEQANEAKTATSADNPFVDVFEDELSRLDLMSDDPISMVYNGSAKTSTGSLSQSAKVF